MRPAMSEEPRKEELKDPPLWLQATEEDFAAADVNAALSGTNAVDCYELAEIFNKVSKEANGAGNAALERVAAMLGAVCSFHFKPHERDDPFGPKARFGDRRTAQPSDFKGAPVRVLASHIAQIGNPALRARVADLVWLLDRKQGTAAWSAVAAYTAIINEVRAGTRAFRREKIGLNTFEVAEHLRRAVQIAKAVGWEKDGAKALRELVAEARAIAVREKCAGSFRRLATLDLDYSISDPAIIAAEAESLVPEQSDLHMQHALWHIAGRAHRRAKRQAECDRCLLCAAECLVSVAGKGAGSAMFETHWLEQAIGELHHIANTKERRRQLKHQLVDAQSRIIDEMSHFSHSDDISEIVASAQAAVLGKTLMHAIRALVTISVSPKPEDLERIARDVIEQNPLSSIFASTTYDNDGKPVHRDRGMEGSWEDGGVQRQIAQSERIRRSVTAQGQIETARLAIISEHFIGEDVVGLICLHSPFVPRDRAALFASGILHFFQGDMIAALHTLVPQLENSLRHVLRLHGHDVTKLNDDLTQEDLSFSVLLERLRRELDAIFGSHMVTDLDNVFNHRGGPNLRNRTAHGLVTEWEPYGHDGTYACWLILQLCCIPLLQQWKDLSELYERTE